MATMASSSVRPLPEMDEDCLVDVRRLGVTFRTDHGVVRAIDDVSFSVRRGQVLGLVGESGSGKSVATRAVTRLLPATAAIDETTSIRLRTERLGVIDVAGLSNKDKRLRTIRGGEVGMIFQEPMASFAPTYPVGDPIVEAIRLHRPVTKKDAEEESVELLRRVGIADPGRRARQYPFELSGGMRQRVMIAVALASRPSVLIADEPTTALDVTIQAQILDLLLDLKEELGMAIVFITHDLGVISKVADDIAVMYLGRVMERGPAPRVLGEAAHPYTRKLLAAIPDLARPTVRLQAIAGDIPSALARPTGCPFHTRCDEAIAAECDVKVPEESTVVPGHTVACLLYDSEATA